MRVGQKSIIRRIRFRRPTSAQLVRIAVITGITRDKDIQPTTASYNPNYKMHEAGAFP